MNFDIGKIINSFIGNNAPNNAPNNVINIKPVSSCIKEDFVMIDTNCNDYLSGFPLLYSKLSSEIKYNINCLYIKQFNLGKKIMYQSCAGQSEIDKSFISNIIVIIYSVDGNTLCKIFRTEMFDSDDNLDIDDNIYKLNYPIKKIIATFKTYEKLEVIIECDKELKIYFYFDPFVSREKKNMSLIKKIVIYIHNVEFDKKFIDKMFITSIYDYANDKYFTCFFHDNIFDFHYSDKNTSEILSTSYNNEYSSFLLNDVEIKHNCVFINFDKFALVYNIGLNVVVRH